MEYETLVWMHRKLTEAEDMVGDAYINGVPCKEGFDSMNLALVKAISALQAAERAVKMAAKNLQEAA